MRYALAFFIGLRYTRAKRRQRFISFISLVSMIGIALGVAVLITILSVFNGFDHQVRQQFFSMASEVNLFVPADEPQPLASIAKQVLKVPGVVATAPSVTGQGMMSANGQMQAAYVMGIDPQQEGKVSQLPKNISDGRLLSLQPRHFNMVVGHGIAQNLGLRLGSKVTLLTPQARVTPLGVVPRYKRFTVTGIFRASKGFGFDDSMVFIDLHDAKALFAGGQFNYGLHLKLEDPYAALAVSARLQQLFPMPYQVTNWTDSQGAFFKALAMEKTMMFVVLALIIAVAAFNLVSSLMMTVNDKQADIAILRTIGATPRLISGIFMVQGVMVGMMGCIFGVIAGVLLSLSVTSFVNWLQHVFHVQLVSSAIYFVNYLPSQLQWQDVLTVVVIAFALSLLATIYPAWSAGRTTPAEALRYE